MKYNDISSTRWRERQDQSGSKSSRTKRREKEREILKFSQRVLAVKECRDWWSALSDSNRELVMYHWDRKHYSMKNDFNSWIINESKNVKADVDKLRDIRIDNLLES